MCRIVWWERLREGKGAIPLLHGPRGQKILRRALNRSMKYKNLSTALKPSTYRKS